MQEYVLTYAVGTQEDAVLLVLKDRPKWQAGRLNLPGGKLEGNEDPLAAANRELVEEAGLPIVARTAKKMGVILGTQCVVHCVRGNVAAMTINPREGETEQVEWFHWNDALNDRRLMPNLRVILPLMRSGVSGWEISDDYQTRKRTKEWHSVSMSIPDEKFFE